MSETPHVMPAGHTPPKGFDTTATETRYLKKSGKVEGEQMFEPVTLCGGQVAIIGKGTDVDDGDTWLDIGFTDALCGIPTHELLPQRAALSRQGIMGLADKGLNLPECNAAKMNEYLSKYLTKNGDKIPIKTMCKRNGWKGKEMFVCGTRGITATNIIDVSPTDPTISTHMKKGGTFETWAEGVADIMAYEVMRLKMYAALTAPLLQMLQVGNFVLDQHALTGRLKTFTGNVAMSAYGDPVGLQQSANQTVTAAEYKCVLAEDCCTFFDETSTAKPEFFEPFVYMVGNGRQRGRGNKDGGLRHERTFRGVVLTTGERPIITEKTMGGMDARVIEYDKGINTKYPHAETVKAVISENHGHLIEMFIQYVIAHRNEIIQRHADISSEYGGDVGKDIRKGRQFAAIATAGEIVDTLLSDNVAQDVGAVELLGDVLKYTTNQQHSIAYHIKAVHHVLDWYTTSQNRFYAKDCETHGADKTIISGWFDEQCLYIPQATFTEVLEGGGFTMGAIREPWIKLGILRTTKDGDRVKPLTRPLIGERQQWVITLDRETMDIVASGDTE